MICHLCLCGLQYRKPSLCSSVTGALWDLLTTAHLRKQALLFLSCWPWDRDDYCLCLLYTAGSPLSLCSHLWYFLYHHSVWAAKSMHQVLLWGASRLGLKVFQTSAAVLAGCRKSKLWCGTRCLCLWSWSLRFLRTYDDTVPLCQEKLAGKVQMSSQTQPSWCNKQWVSFVKHWYTQICT